MSFCSADSVGCLLRDFFQLVGYDTSANVGRADELRVGSHYQGPETSTVFSKLFVPSDFAEIVKYISI